MEPPSAPLVTTIRERCRRCYTCVRECPAKAIRIASGQAEVLTDRCISCGNCVRVCSQAAQKVLDQTELVEKLLRTHDRIAALVAPSFPAEFVEVNYEFLVGMIRALGFKLVSEVGFGADLVAAEYQKLHESDGRRFIATTCPAIVGYIERYHPDLVPALAPVVSPMVATARALRRIYGTDMKVVFIGPCIAKKGEAASALIHGDVDAVLTFIELEEMLRRHAIIPESVTPSDFDPPHGGLGILFPISRGMLQAAQLPEDLLASMGQLAAGIAHEVNNPLGTVLMLSHTLLEEVGRGSPQHDDPALIASEADRCRKIVSGLLQFARKNKVETRATNLCGLTEKTVRMLHIPAGTTVKFAHEIQDLRAEVDRDQVAQVLTNLINNAVDAMPNGGTLTILTGTNQRDVRFQVRDTGVGIPPEIQKKIFEPFFTTRPAGKGTGLGLSVTYEIVKMHQGDIRLESNADPRAGPTGTTFTVTLPRQRLTP